MSLQADKWIKKMALEEGMIEPFVGEQVRYDECGNKVISYGLSSYGYDLRVSDEFMV
ncbi:MAG: dCTP deaminase, partial [Chlamydiae bacterium]|nr:dCTP deaminase [Chlamydiota bacterium]